MSITERMKRDQIATRKLRSLYPGIVISQGWVQAKETILNTPKEQWGPEIKDLVRRLELNKRLREIADMDLDVFYSANAASDYLANPEDFRKSFVKYAGAMHSIEFVIDEINRRKLKVKGCRRDGGIVHLFYKRRLGFLKLEKGELLLEIVSNDKENN